MKTAQNLRFLMEILQNHKRMSAKAFRRLAYMRYAVRGSILINSVIHEHEQLESGVL